MHIYTHVQAKIEYDKLIEANRSTPKTKIQTERHHIIPKSLGGTNDKENIVNLYHKDHFLAHFYLWIIHHNKQMALAFFTMFTLHKHELNETLLNEYAEEYQSLKEEISKSLGDKIRGTPKSEETKNKMRESALKGQSKERTIKRLQTLKMQKEEKIKNGEYSPRIRSKESINKATETRKINKQRKELENGGPIINVRLPEHTAKISASRKANNEQKRLKNGGPIPLSDAHKKAISEGNKGKVFSKECRDNISLSKKGKPNLKLKGKNRIFSEETKRKMSESAKTRKTAKKHKS